MDSLQTIADTLQTARDGQLRGDELARRVRAAGPLPAGLPPRYREVLDALLDRLESSALFSEESCSFSQRDLLDALGQWVHKASAALNHSRH